MRHPGWVRTPRLMFLSAAPVRSLRTCSAPDTGVTPRCDSTASRGPDACKPGSGLARCRRARHPRPSSRRARPGVASVSAAKRVPDARCPSVRACRPGTPSTGPLSHAYRQRLAPTTRRVEDAASPVNSRRTDDPAYRGEICGNPKPFNPAAAGSLSAFVDGVRSPFALNALPQPTAKPVRPHG